MVLQNLAEVWKRMAVTTAFRAQEYSLRRPEAIARIGLEPET